jgi:hypothetical protein
MNREFGVWSSEFGVRNSEFGVPATREKSEFGIKGVFILPEADTLKGAATKNKAHLRGLNCFLI